MKNWRNRFSLAGCALALSAALIVTLSTPAAAATASISGKISACGVNQYYSTGRVNSLNQNAVTFKATSLGPCGSGSLSLGLRASSGVASSFAKTTVTNTSSVFRFKATNGASYISGGTFYLTASSPGACGGSCGSFTGTLTYSVPAG